MPNVRIIPIVLGIFGYTYGSLLGIFFAGMLTKTRGNDRGNLIAMIAGFIVVAILSDLAERRSRESSARSSYAQPGWLPIDGIPVVDLLRNHRHFSGGDSFDRSPASAGVSDASIYAQVDRR